MLDALNAAFHPEDRVSALGELSLPDALWESGPPLAIRDRNGEFSFANPAFKDLFDALRAANALSPAEDLAAVIEGLGPPYTEDLVLRIEGKTRFFLARHELVVREAADSPYVMDDFIE